MRPKSRARKLSSRGRFWTPYFSASTIFAHGKSRLCGRKQRGKEAFCTPINPCARRACSRSIVVGLLVVGILCTATSANVTSRARARARELMGCHDAPRTNSRSTAREMSPRHSTQPNAEFGSPSHWDTMHHGRSRAVCLTRLDLVQGHSSLETVTSDHGCSGRWGSV
jgi:hypothetical protein